MTENDVQEYFRKKLKELMLTKGWNQSELARRSKMGRDNISCYVRGKSIPNSPQLHKISKALGVDPNELMPGVIPEAEEVNCCDSPFEVKQLDDNKYYVKVGQILNQKQMTEIIKILANNS